MSTIKVDLLPTNKSRDSTRTALAKEACDLSFGEFIKFWIGLPLISMMLIGLCFILAPEWNYLVGSFFLAPLIASLIMGINSRINHNRFLKKHNLKKEDFSVLYQEHWNNL